jgi:hypothetical protein
VTIQLKAKLSDTSRALDIIASADPHLSGIVLAANTFYQVTLVAMVDAGATPDFKGGLSVPADIAYGMMHWVAGNQAVYGSNFSPGGGSAWQSTAHLAAGTTLAHSGLDTAGSLGMIRATGYILTASAGTLAFNWAQNVSSATGTTLKKGSYLRVEALTAPRGSYLIKQADESRATFPGVYEDDSELVDFPLEANKVYALDLGVHGHTKYDFNHNLNIKYFYSGTVDSLNSQMCEERYYTVGANAYTTSGVGLVQSRGVFDLARTIDSGGSNSTSARVISRYYGLLRTVDAGTLKLGWYKSYNGGGATTYPLVVYAGSWFSAIDLTDSFV